MSVGNSHLEQSPPEEINIEAYEKSMHLGGFAMWATLTAASVINYSIDQDSFQSSMWVASGVGLALFAEKIRHDRVEPFKQA